MLSSFVWFPELRAEMLDKQSMWGFATANVGVQDRNPVQKRVENLRAWTADLKHFCIVWTEGCDGGRSYSELSWRAVWRRVFVVQYVRGNLEV